jgi:hypothetical protein
VAVEASSKIGSYEGEMLNGDLTNLRASRHWHFDRHVSEDHCHLTFAVDTEVIGVGYQLDYCSVAVSKYYYKSKEYMNEQVAMGLEKYAKIALDVVAAAAA